MPGCGHQGELYCLQFSIKMSLSSCFCCQLLGTPIKIICWLTSYFQIKTLSLYKRQGLRAPNSNNTKTMFPRLLHIEQNNKNLLLWFKEWMIFKLYHLKWKIRVSLIAKRGFPPNWQYSWRHVEERSVLENTLLLKKELRSKSLKQTIIFPNRYCSS